MKRVIPKLPNEGVRLVGFLYDHEDKSLLGEDMLEVQFDNGILIDAGWFPEGDPHGNYLIKVTDGLEELIPAIPVKSIHEAKQSVESLAQRYSKATASFSTTNAIEVRNETPGFFASVGISCAFSTNCNTTPSVCLA